MVTHKKYAFIITFLLACCNSRERHAHSAKPESAVTFSTHPNSLLLREGQPYIIRLATYNCFYSSEQTIIITPTTAGNYVVTFKTKASNKEDQTITKHLPSSFYHSLNEFNVLYKALHKSKFSKTNTDTSSATAGVTSLSIQDGFMNYGYAVDPRIDLQGYYELLSAIFKFEENKKDS